MQEMKITMKRIEEIRPYENNPRKNDRAVAGVVRSIEKFGFQQPIVVDAGGVIIIGHTRYKAAMKLGLEKVPVYVADHLSAEETKALRIADNACHDHSSWDLRRLKIETEDLKALDDDLTLLMLPENIRLKLYPPPFDDEKRNSEKAVYRSVILITIGFWDCLIYPDDPSHAILSDAFGPGKIIEDQQKTAIIDAIIKVINGNFKREN